MMSNYKLIPLQQLKQRTLDNLPDTIRPRLKDITSTDIVIIQHIGFQQYLI